MQMRLSSSLVLFALATAVAVPAAAQTNPARNIPVSGSVPSTGGTFSGLFTIQGFQYQSGVVSAVGTLAGTIRNAAGTAVATVSNTTVTMPMTQASGSCPVLHLDLGPLNLDLLGLQISLNQVVLDITAQSGPGNLLANLLCAVAHLLDSNASGAAIAQKLNQILASL